MKVLVVEDNLGDARFLRETLRDHARGEIRLTHVPRLKDAIKKLAFQKMDVILLDLFLPDGAGLETLATVRKAAPHTPIIVLTGWSGDGMTLKAIQSGAQFFVAKNRLEGGALVRALRYYAKAG